MDNLTHSLFGWTIARAGLGRRVPYATATLILASNAADVDIVAGFRSGVDYLAVHRGPTHGPLGVIGLGLVTAGIMSGWTRFRSRQPVMRDVPLDHFLEWWMLATIGLLCHVLMDLPTPYGTRLLSPFVWTWYALDWMPIIDLYLWIVLIVALVAGSRTQPRRAAVIALGLMAIDYSARAALHGRALADGALFEATGIRNPCVSAPTFVAHSAAIEVPATTAGSCIEAAALPTFFSPFTWRIVRQHPGFYELSDRRISGDPATVRSMRLATDEGADAMRVRGTRPGRVYFDFARFPIVQIANRTSTLTTVRLLDARFMSGFAGGGDASTGARLSVLVTVDESGRVVEQRFGK